MRGKRASRALFALTGSLCTNGQHPPHSPPLRRWSQRERRLLLLQLYTHPRPSPRPRDGSPMHSNQRLRRSGRTEHTVPLVLTAPASTRHAAADAERPPRRLLTSSTGTMHWRMTPELWPRIGLVRPSVRPSHMPESRMRADEMPCAASRRFRRAASNSQGRVWTATPMLITVSPRPAISSRPPSTTATLLAAAATRMLRIAAQVMPDIPTLGL
mmetsp:Transcript_20706/g.63387  ORF Transcript_20706/g.63387 Transcript_20706/m.63387 type:complete len:214 (-) Transcript_20706:1861-2502(-)